MPALVFAVMAAGGAGDKVARVDRTFSFRQVAEKKDRRVAVRAGDNDVPPFGERTSRQRGNCFLSGWNTGAGDELS